jgi:hypothetical protein
MDYFFVSIFLICLTFIFNSALSVAFTMTLQKSKYTQIEKWPNKFEY